MPNEILIEIADLLSSEYPSENKKELREEFLKILEISFPLLSKRVFTVSRSKNSIEEIWKSIKDFGEEDFEPALKKTNRLILAFVISKFMNNKKIGMKITSAVLNKISSP